MEKNDRGQVFAPWTEAQVASLNQYQRSHFHPYTGSGGDLIATAAGWVEYPSGPVVQRWAHDWTTDWSWCRYEWRPGDQ